MRSMKLVICFIVVLLSISACSKENWVSIGANMYVDSASTKRNGDIGQINIKFSGTISPLEFDCVNKKSIDYPDTELDENHPLTEAMKISCKRWFEVWK